jgi:hypothetical protein
MHRAVVRARGGAIYCENVDQYRLQICPATVLINRIRDINQHAIKYINAPYIFAGERKKIICRKKNYGANKRQRNKCKLMEKQWHRADF